MGHKSSVRRLPKELRDEVDRLLNDGRYTIRQVVEHMRGLGAELSKSAIGRYSQNLESLAGDMRVAREMANAIGRELEGLPDGDVGRLAIESLNTLLLKVRMAMVDEEVSPADIEKLSAAARNLQGALRSNVDTEIKIRERAAKDAAKVAEKVMVKQGLSAETVNAVRASILGITK